MRNLLYRASHEVRSMKGGGSMGFFWISCTFLAELPGYVLRYWAGVWFGTVILPLYQHLSFARHHPVAPAYIGWAVVILCLLMHVMIAVRQLSAPQQERVKMRLRSPSKREQEEVDRAYKTITQKATVNRALPFFHPQRFRVYQGQGYRVRFLGRTLLIDAALFQTAGSPYLPALLAHALWSYNGSDLRVRSLLHLFPDASYIRLGFTGRFLTWIGWQFYKRSQVYRADAYAAKVGQKHALIQTLEEVFLPLDEPRAHYFYDEPYIESRLDRLHAFPS